MKSKIFLFHLQVLQKIQGDSSDDSRNQSDSSDDFLSRRTRLSEIYETCNYSIVEPASFMEATKHEKWVKAMEEEMHMIEKNQTW